VKQPPTGLHRATGLRVALLRAAFNAPVVEGLAGGAREALLQAGVAPADLHELAVPGAFELPLAALAAARSGRFDAVVALGAVIRGETDHYEHVARAATDGLLRATLETGVPVGFGVLTVTEEEQAVARAAPGPENKGAEAARATVAMVHVLRSLNEKDTAERQRAQRTRTRARKARGRKP